MYGDQMGGAQNVMYYHSGPWAGGPWDIVGTHPWLLGLLAMLAPIFLIVMLWSLVWKGLALWHSGRRGQYWWFMILLVVNTFGILEIIYLFFVAKLKFNELFSTHSHGHNHHA